MHDYLNLNLYYNLLNFSFQLGYNKDQKLLHQLDFEDNQTIHVKMVTPSSTASTSQLKEVIQGFPYCLSTYEPIYDNASLNIYPWCNVTNHFSH